MSNKATLQEIIDWYIPSITQGSWHTDMMKEYAELYARKCLMIASKEAALDVEWNGEVESDRCEYTPVIDIYSIINITLPNHE